MNTRNKVMMDKVLVIGDDTRSFLSTVRSLGRQGLEVHVAPFNFRSPALSSRYIHASHFLPYYLDGGQEWLDAMRTLLREQHFSLVVPCDERALLPLCLHREELSAFAALAIPSPEALDQFFNKLSTRRLAESVGVPVARGRLLSPTDTADSIAADLGLPVVIKDPMSYALPELYVRTSTRIIRERSELADWLARHDHTAGQVLLENMFPGFGLGVSVLCHEGKVLQAFEHHRAHELNGSSYYRKSAPIDPERLAAVEQMVRASAYTGLAMFEFKVNPADGKWILIEVNARPWGSLPLPVSIGVDFPYRLYRLLVRGEPTAPVPYPAGRYCRNLIQDIWQARSGAAALVRQPVRFAAHCAGWVWSFHRIALGREHHDTLVLDDPKPGLRELREFVNDRIPFLRPRARKTVPDGVTLPQYLQRLAQERQRPVNVLFVCQGNINRSSYAELKSKQLFDADGFRFSSAGMLPRNRRGSPAIAIAAAARHGVDMAAHRSRHATLGLLEGADVVIAFDEINLGNIAARYPNLDKPVFLLGEADSNGAPQILDPEGKNETTFLSTFERIDGALAKLARAVGTSGHAALKTTSC
jgi:protein-tyrosine-phosphatase/predicted ATP-grasp superfamily ATP-dependent carboligase